MRVFRSVMHAVLLASVGAGGAVYRNPVIRGVNPDPSVVRVGTEYFAVTSSFEYFPACPVYHSVDLVHWQRIGYALGRVEQFRALHDEHPSTYACTLRYHDGTFYALTTDVRGEGNFLVSAQDPRGPWSLPVLIDKGMFDPSLLFDDDGKVYYTRRGPDGEHTIVQAEIDVASGKLLTPLRVISNGNVTHDAEGPHLYKIQDWYYLSLAEGGSRFLHMETIGRARTPWGPFDPDPANPWVSQHIDWDYAVRSIGHCDLVDTPQGSWWTLCLGTRHFDTSHFSMGRESFLFPVSWSDGWPRVDSSDMQRLTVTADTPAQHDTPGQLDTPAQHSLASLPERDDFSATELRSDWNTFGPAGMDVLSLTERPGFLRLHGQPTGLSFKETSAFVGLRQKEWWTTSTTRLEFEPKSEADAAGLTVFMSPRFHYDIVKTMCAAGPCVRLIKQIADARFVAAEAHAPHGAIRLRIESTPLRYTFSYAGDDGRWQELGSGETQVISSEVASVWSGMYIGMMSECASPSNGPPADFDWFEAKSYEDNAWALAH